MLTKAKIKIGQRALKEMGYDPGPIDGISGPRTIAAIDRWRRDLTATTVIPPEWLPNVPMQRIIVHWTAGTNEASEFDREHYHLLVEGGGKVVRGKPSIALNVTPVQAGYAAHTRAANSGSIGVALCGMANAMETPFFAGPFPINEAQWDQMLIVLAELCRAYDIAPERETLLSHAEVQGTLKINQAGKWDITRLPFPPQISGALAVGDYMRGRVKDLI